MFRKTPYKRSIFSLLLALITQSIWSAEDINTPFPRVGRVTLSAVGAGSMGIFGGDAMQPVYGNDNGFLFADFMGDRATNTTFLWSPGVGYRQVVNNQVWGGLIFLAIMKR